jgi:hypothetical protein
LRGAATEAFVIRALAACRPPATHITIVHVEGDGLWVEDGREAMAIADSLAPRRRNQMELEAGE